MQRWVATTNDLHYCEITFDGDWFRLKVENEYGEVIRANDSISLEGAKKQVKRLVGNGMKLRWLESKSSPVRMHIPKGTRISAHKIRQAMMCPVCKQNHKGDKHDG